MFQRYQREEREAALLARKQKTYALLDADDEDDDIKPSKGAELITSLAMQPPSGNVDSRQKHFRRKRDSQENEEEVTFCPVQWNVLVFDLYCCILTLPFF